MTTIKMNCDKCGKRTTVSELFIDIGDVYLPGNSIEVTCSKCGETDRMHVPS